MSLTSRVGHQMESVRSYRGRLSEEIALDDEERMISTRIECKGIIFDSYHSRATCYRWRR